ATTLGRAPRIVASWQMTIVPNRPAPITPTRTGAPAASRASRRSLNTAGPPHAERAGRDDPGRLSRSSRPPRGGSTSRRGARLGRSVAAPARAAAAASSRRVATPGLPSHDEDRGEDPPGLPVATPGTERNLTRLILGDRGGDLELMLARPALKHVGHGVSLPLSLRESPIRG